ncbi:MAG: hypothetical protein RIQ60_3448 [Pseudomonadota bacterium]|jgi:competence protein ComEA
MIRFLIGMLFMVLSGLVGASVDINKATQAELESIKGIGPAMSGRILDERKKGGYKDWLDVIDRVKGVGPGNAAKFSDGGLTVDGASYTRPAAAAVKAMSKASGSSGGKAGDKKP